MPTNFPFRASVQFDNEASRLEAYNQMLPQFNAMLPEEVILLNTEVPSVVATVLGALPEILAIRPELEKLADFDVSHLDQLETCALALSHAHGQCVTAAKASDDLAELNMEAESTVGRLHSDVSGLIYRKILDPSTLRAFGGGTGYKHVANDLVVLVSLLRESWPKIQGKAACTMDEIERADRLATRMLRLVGLREQAPAVTAAWTETRNRAFTLLLRRYDAVRRAVAYVRWNQGDADAIAPTLYFGHNKPKTPKSEVSATPDEPAVPPAPAPTPAPAPVPAAPPAPVVPGGPYVS